MNSIINALNNIGFWDIYQIDIIGWIGNVFFVLGAILLAKKRMSGWICQILGNLAYAFVGFAFKTSSLWALSFLLIIINIYGILQWRENNG